jgi:two-component system, chemotaxis family, CheB/CheR fusion protein
VKKKVRQLKPAAEKETTQTRIAKAVPPKKVTFRIVGIGASAGGLEAIEQFFSTMPSNSGVAFVIVQHLDPTAHSSMPEILSRFTKLPVQVASNGLKVEPDSIYLIPPSKSMKVQNGMLYLQEPAQPQGLRLPIDFFFSSLAKEKGPDAICVILSGTGSDGTLGLKAVKAEQGTVFVQDPDSAKYDGMPRSAINTGLVDFVLNPVQIAEKLIEFLKYSTINGAESSAAAKESTEPLQQIFAILQARTGHDFSSYKGPTVIRRLERRMSVKQIKDIAAYARFLKGNEDEVKALLKDLLISVTNFFRDPRAFEVLKAQLQELINQKAPGSDLRVWVAGCATGEEVYSIAVIVAECIGEAEKHLKVQIYGTDIDIDALHTARTGNYPDNIVADVTPSRLKQFFTKQDSTYSIKKEIRERVVFAPQDFIKDPPFSKMDLICCRNLLIYLDSDMQKRLIPLLHYSLNPGGILFLGASETLGDAKDMFTVLDKKWKIYQRREVVLNSDRLKFPAAFTPSAGELTGESPRSVTEARMPELAEKIFLDDYAPTFAVIDEKYRLVYVRGRTGKYLEIASGQPSLSILEMAREGLRTELGSALYRATNEKKKIVHERIRVRLDGGFQMVNLTVAPLSGTGIPSGFLIIVFQDLEPAPAEAKSKPATKSRKRVTELEQELSLTRENLQATIEELEATNEEMKSANEELQSNNEELQSTNEELDTSREELQSLNEELNTLNSELQDKNELLSRANDDLNNFVNRTDIAIILLDDELKIRSYTPSTSDVFNIRNVDVGRPLDEINSRLAYDKMVDEAREVLRTLQPREVEVQRKDGHWYNMRISSYRTAQNVVSGLVMSLLDINEQKKAAEKLLETRDYLDNLFNYANAPIIVWNADLKITRFNHALEQLTGRSADKILGKKVDILIHPDKRREGLQEINLATMKGQRWENVEIPIQNTDGSTRIVLWNSATLFDADGKTPIATIAQGQDITERKKMEDAMRESEERFRALSETSPVGVGVSSAEGVLLYTNRSYNLILGYNPGELLGRKAIDLYWNAENRRSWVGVLRDTGVVRDYEARLKRKNGTPVWVSINATPISYGEKQAVMGTIQDITERKKAEENLIQRTDELEDSTKALEASNAELESFSYSVSHDLKAPLRGINGFSTALLEEYADKLDERGKEYLNNILQSSQLMGLLIDDILKLSRINRSELNTEKIDMSEIVSAIAEELQHSQPDRKAEFIVPPGITANGDLHLLKIMLRNLLENAWKFTIKRPESRIEFGVMKREDTPVYYVKDNGIGFDMQYSDKLFKPFSRLHSQEEYPGTGIGLAMVQRIVRRHGGRIWAEGRMGQGSTFHFILE